MKTIKIVLLLLAFSAVTFYSCSDSDPIENNPVVTQQSVALRTVLNQIKKTNDISGKSVKPAGKAALTNPFCFEFIYPITLTLTNGANVTIENFQGLLDILESESPNLYVTGIAFPFQVAYGGALHTISNEAAFTELIQYCGFNTFNEDLANTFCFDIVFPIGVVVGSDLLLEVNSLEELQQYINQNNNYSVAIVYPISVTYEGQLVVINNLYELYDMINNCDSCICTLEYAPVCIQTANGIVEYGNMCFAECAGFSQNDIVSCSPIPGCDINNIGSAVTGCNPDGTYGLQLTWNYGNIPPSTTFIIRDVAGNILGGGPFTLSQLPLTWYSQPNSGTGQTIGVSVTLGNGTCQFPITWTEPICDPCNTCPDLYEPVCVQTATGIMQYNNSCIAICAGYTQNDFITCGVAPNNFGTQLGSCFNIQYPVHVQHQGALVLINSNSELLQYWFPAMGPMPIMNYPVTAIFGNTFYTFNSQAEFQSQIGLSCN